MRSTVRISHTKTPVEVGERTEVAKRPYEKDCAKWVMMPAFAKPRRKVLVERIGKIREWVETCLQFDREKHPRKDRAKGWNHLRRAVYQHVKEACPDVDICKLGVAWPFAKALNELPRR